MIHIQDIHDSHAPSQSRTESSRISNNGGKINALTPCRSRKRRKSASMRCLIPACQLSYTLISSSQENNDDQGSQKRDGSVNAPLAEDDAEVLRGPGEEHLNGDKHVSRGTRIEHQAQNQRDERIVNRTEYQRKLTFMLHWPPISIPPWPP